METVDKKVARGTHIVLSRDRFAQIVEVIVSRPLSEVGHLIPFITDGDDKTLLSDGGWVLDLADVVDKIDRERGIGAEPPAQDKTASKEARLKKAEEAHAVA